MRSETTGITASEVESHTGVSHSRKRSGYKIVASENRQDATWKRKAL